MIFFDVTSSAKTSPLASVMTEEEEHELLHPSDNEVYPRLRKYQYLKLLTHSFEFGRVDLGTLLIEWFCYLLSTAFLCARLEGFILWDWGGVAAPLFVGLSLGFLRSAFCGKRSRCALGARFVYGILGIMLAIFVVVRVRQDMEWPWDAVFSPLYVALGASLLVSCCGWAWMMWLISRDKLIKLELSVIWVCAILFITTVRFTASKLDNQALTEGWSWWRVFAPLWIIHALLMLVGAYFFVTFPDQAFKEDNLISGTGTKMNLPSIKPRYRTNFFFLLIIVLNIPMWIFSVLLCNFADRLWMGMEAPYRPSVLFAPLFMAEIFVIIALIYARRRRGSYCVRIDNGPGVPNTEIW